MEISEEKLMQFVNAVRLMNMKDLDLAEANAEPDPLTRMTMLTVCGAVNTYNATWRKMRDLALERLEKV